MQRQIIINPNELARKCSQLISFCNKNSLKQGTFVHSPLIKLGLEDHLYLTNNLLSLYAKCDGVKYARRLFDEMPRRDVVSWTALISAYSDTQNHDSSLELFDEMVISGESLNEFTFSTVLRSCAALREFECGARVHACVIKKGFETNPVLCSGLIDFYSKCEHIEEAYEWLSGADTGDTVSWTTMISSLVQARRWRRALGLFSDMTRVGVPPNEFTFAKLLSASASLSLDCVRLLHAYVLFCGIKLTVAVKTALVDAYSRFQRMEDAIRVSNSTPEHDILLWTSIISGFARNLQFKEGFDTFREMQISDTEPNSFVYSAMLSICSSIQSLELGKLIHSLAIQSGFDDDIAVGNALVDMYMKCDPTTTDAMRVFGEMTSLNVISWTTLISGLADHGLTEDSFVLFTEMLARGIVPNSYTLSSVLSACIRAKSSTQVLKLHGYIIKTKADNDIVVENSLVDAYAGLGLVDDARRVISMMELIDAITYTSFATRLNQLGHHEMALNTFSHMHINDVKMDRYSLAGFLSASASLGRLEMGKLLHGYSMKSGLSSRVSVSNSLVDLYGKCGYIDDAKRAFKEITEPDAVSWNGLMSGLASAGYISSALCAFDDMRLAGADPDQVTFLLLLFACSHGQLVELGLEYFHSMKDVYNLEPQLDHYACLVDLLSRAGKLEEAVGVLETMPFAPTALFFKTLLSACRWHGKLPLGEDMARRGLELDPSDPAFYVLLADLYDGWGWSELAGKTRMLMREKGLEIDQAQSSVELHGKVHCFTAGDTSHEETNTIHKQIESLKRMIKGQGYPYRDKSDASFHSAKLAVALGLLKAPSRAPIHIVKNKHICRDCHSFISFVTRIADRQIIVRDGTRIHIFRNGQCSSKETCHLG